MTPFGQDDGLEISITRRLGAWQARLCWIGLSDRLEKASGGLTMPSVHDQLPNTFFLQKVASRTVDFFFCSDTLKGIMSVKGKERGTEATTPDCSASEVVVRSESGCKVLIFRKPSCHDDGKTIELERGQALSGFDAMDDSGEFRDVSLVYIAERSKRAPTRAMLARAAAESREVSSLVVPRWLKKVLLMATFTAWTAAAIAISLALA